MSNPNMNQSTFFDGLTALLNTRSGGMGDITTLGKIIRDNKYDPLQLNVGGEKDNTFFGPCTQTICPCGISNCSVVLCPPGCCPKFPVKGCDKHYGVKGFVQQVIGLQNIVVQNDSTGSLTGQKTGFYKCNDLYFLQLSLAVSFKNSDGANTPIIVKGGATFYLQDINDLNFGYKAQANDVVLKLNLILPITNVEGNWGFTTPVYDNIDTVTSISIGQITIPNNEFDSPLFRLYSLCITLFQPTIDFVFGIFRSKIQEIIGGVLNGVIKSQIKDLINKNPTTCPKYLFLDTTNLINACRGAYDFDEFNANGNCPDSINCVTTKLSVNECTNLFANDEDLNFENLDGTSFSTKCRPGSYVPKNNSIWKKTWFIVLISIFGVLIVYQMFRAIQYRKKSRQLNFF